MVKRNSEHMNNFQKYDNWLFGLFLSPPPPRRLLNFDFSALRSPPLPAYSEHSTSRISTLSYSPHIRQCRVPTFRFCCSQ